MRAMVLCLVIRGSADVVTALIGPVLSLYRIPDGRRAGVRRTGTSVEVDDSRYGHIDPLPVLSRLLFARYVALCVSDCIIISSHIIL